jgi:hypothetical protein
MLISAMPRRLAVLAATVGLAASSAMSVAAAEPQKASGPPPKFTSAMAFDISPALHDLAPRVARAAVGSDPDAQPVEIRPDRGPVAPD